MGKSVCSIYSIQTRLFEKGFRGDIKKNFDWSLIGLRICLWSNFSTDSEPGWYPIVANKGWEVGIGGALEQFLI